MTPIISCYRLSPVSFVPLTVFLHIFEADLSFTRTSESEEDKSPLMADVGQLSRCERCGETLEDFITSCENWAQKVRDFKVAIS